MSITQHLEHLALKDPDERQQAMADVLTMEGLSYTVQEEGPSREYPRGIKNYLVQIGETPSILFCAHYDAYPGSFGVNDNASSLCILIELAKTFQKEGFAAQFAFFDGEEAGNAGSKLYVDLMDASQITAVVNLDVCGYGDHLVVYGKGHEKKQVFQTFAAKEVLERHTGQIVKYLPPSDNESFSRSKIPTLSVAVVPYWDIQYLKTLASYGGGLLGRPPEFEMILGEMDVITTMHGGYRDKIEWIEPDAMQMVYDYLYDATHTTLTEQKRFKGLSGLFRKK